MLKQIFIAARTTRRLAASPVRRDASQMSEAIFNRSDFILLSLDDISNDGID